MNLGKTRLARLALIDGRQMKQKAALLFSDSRILCFSVFVVFVLLLPCLLA